MARLRLILTEIQSGKARGVGALLLLVILVPLSLCYQLAVQVHAVLCNVGLLKARKVAGKIISIGNLTTGGTGKTPVTLLLAEWLADHNQRCGILSRGYRSESERHANIAVGSGLTADQSDTFGDEVVLLARKLPTCWFGIGKDRHRNALKLSEEQGVSVFLLDDGFQHRRLRRDLDIVLVDATNPFGRGWLLPAGNLREPVSALSRADLALITRTESVAQEQVNRLADRLAGYIKPERIFRMRTAIRRVSDFATGATIELNKLAGHRAVAFCGIGNPESFHLLLDTNGITVADCITYGDHHRYGPPDIQWLRSLLTKEGNTILLTTEKDAIKLPPDAFAPGTCRVVEISVVFADRADIFWGKIGEVLAC